jgi:hypothetical protein
MNKKEPHFVDQLTNLFVLSMDGTISEEQFRILTNILKTNTAAREFFYDFIASYIGLDQLGILSEQNEEQENWSSQQIWDELLKIEKTAPEVEIPAAPKEPEEDKKPTENKKVHPKVSKFSVFSLVLSSAALIFVIAYGTIVSMKRGVEVATLTDSLQARWAEPTMSIPKDGRLSTEQRFVLINGFAAVKTDQGVELTFEAPAEFKMMSNGDLQLKSGRVYALVAPQGFGFTVSTLNSKIIDLGTEFGVRADAAGSSDVYVFKGKVQLFAGPKEQAKTGRVVMENKAVRYDAASRRIDEIPFEERGFVRSIDSKTNTTWRGRTQIDLADIVGGGNGFGSGHLGIGIDPGTGQATDIMFSNRRATNEYRPVLSNPFIDGVFVPDGRSKQVVSSKGHIFENAPVTSGMYFSDVFTMPGGLDSEFNDIVSMSKKASSKAVHRDKEERTSETQSVLLHANVGITYDLEAIRSLFSNGRILRFQSQYGIAMSATRLPNVDFWILVDGEVRHKRTHVTEQNVAYSVDLALSDNDRFLTLITTDGGDPEGRIYKNLTLTMIDSDWGMFVNPVLILE